jgi:murein DD-endopeptidase MepM/ murein hydrolase activator NlpD
MPKLRAIAFVTLVAFGASASTSKYTLRWGDTLARVAQKLGLPMQALVVVNRIPDANRVKQGQVIIVPDKASAQLAIAKPIAAVAPAGKAAPAAVAPAAPRPSPTSTYVVQAGDNLAGIAKKFNTTVADLVGRNAIKNPNQVRIGATLTVPFVGPPPLCPVKGAAKFDVSNNFGAPRVGHPHMGNDIFVTKRGVDVIAPVGGTVRFANGAIAGFAFYLDGEDGTTYYGAHLAGFNVRPGHVDRGQVIGEVGRTGDAEATPMHLHFEVHPQGATAVDPYAFLVGICTG